MGVIVHIESFRRKVVEKPLPDTKEKKHTIFFLLSIDNTATVDAIDKMADALVCVHNIRMQTLYEMVEHKTFSNISNGFTREEMFNYTSLSQFFYSYNEIMLTATCSVLFGVFDDLPLKLSVMSLAWNKYLQATLEWGDDDVG